LKTLAGRKFGEAQGKTRPNTIIVTDEITVSSIVPMVMGSRQTRTLIQPNKAAAVTIMLTSASVVMALNSAYLIQIDRELLLVIGNRNSLKFSLAVWWVGF
jgi:hypothetical protein